MKKSGLFIGIFILLIAMAEEIQAQDIAEQEQQGSHEDGEYC